MNSRQLRDRVSIGFEVVALVGVVAVILGMAIPSVVKRRDRDARKNIEQSIREGDSATVKRALKARTDVNASVYEEWFAEDGTRISMRYSYLSLAVKSDHAEIVRILLDRGADVDGTLWGNWRPPIYWAAVNGNQEIFDLLLAAGAGLNVVVENKTALQHAESSDKEAAEFLKNNGAK